MCQFVIKDSPREQPDGEIYWTRWGLGCGPLPPNTSVCFPARSLPSPTVQGFKEVFSGVKTDCPLNSQSIPGGEGRSWNLQGSDQAWSPWGLASCWSSLEAHQNKKCPYHPGHSEGVNSGSGSKDRDQRVEHAIFLSVMKWQDFRISMSWTKDKDQICISYCALPTNSLAFTSLLSIRPRRTHSFSHSELQRRRHKHPLYYKTRSCFWTPWKGDFRLCIHHMAKMWYTRKQTISRRCLHADPTDQWGCLCSHQFFWAWVAPMVWGFYHSRTVALKLPMSFGARDWKSFPRKGMWWAALLSPTINLSIVFPKY